MKAFKFIKDKLLKLHSEMSVVISSLLNYVYKIPHDKQLHILVNIIIVLALYPISMIGSVLAALLISLMKDIYDCSKQHKPHLDLGDIKADIVGV